MNEIWLYEMALRVTCRSASTIILVKLSTTNPTLINMESNSIPRSDKPANNFFKNFIICTFCQEF